MRYPKTDVPLYPDSDDGPFVLDNTEPAAAVWDQQALNAILPAFARRGSATMRDAYMYALGVVANEVWAASSRTFGAQQSPRFAVGIELDAWGDKLRLPRGQNEDDGTYRERLMTAKPGPSIGSMLGAIQPLVVATTEARGALLEPAVDAAFYSDPDSEWTAFYQPETTRLWAYDPTRPDDVTAGAYYVPVVTAPLLWVFLPGDALDDTTTAFAAPPGDYLPSADAEYLGSLVTDWNAFYAPEGESLAQQVIAIINRARLGGVNVVVYIDPYVGGAL